MVNKKSDFFFTMCKETMICFNSVAFVLSLVFAVLMFIIHGKFMVIDEFMEDLGLDELNIQPRVLSATAVAVVTYAMIHLVASCVAKRRVDRVVDKHAGTSMDAMRRRIRASFAESADGYVWYVTCEIGFYLLLLVTWCMPLLNFNMLMWFATALHSLFASIVVCEIREKPLFYLGLDVDYPRLEYTIGGKTIRSVLHHGDREEALYKLHFILMVVDMMLWALILCCSKVDVIAVLWQMVNLIGMSMLINVRSLPNDRFWTEKLSWNAPTEQERVARLLQQV